MTNTDHNQTKRVTDRPYIVTVLAFPDVLLLDIAGPLQVFSSANQILKRQVYDIRIASEKGSPISTDTGVKLLANCDFENAKSTDDLIIPGGPGVKHV